jgi:four helix bundle protein
MSSFRELNVYIEARNLVVRVYALLKKFPEEERFAMCSQLRRSSVSVTSNIAEGISRTSNKDQVHFLNIAFGSLMEVLSQLDIACVLGYITNEEFSEIEAMTKDISKMLSGLRSSIERRNQ